MGNMPWPFFLRCFAFAQVVAQHCIAAIQIQLHATGLLQAQPLMHQGIDFRVMLFRLGNTIKRRQFREQFFQGAALV